MSAEDRLSKVVEEQASHIAALKDKLDKIDTLTSKKWGTHMIFPIEDQVYSDPVKKIQEEMYQQLLVLREGILQSLEASIATATGGVPAQSAQPVAASPATASSTEVAAELAKLREENTKLKYRVGFLVKTLDEVEKKKWGVRLLIKQTRRELEEMNWMYSLLIY